MNDKDFGPSYAIGEWVLVETLGWGQVISHSWIDETWQYLVNLALGKVATLSEKEILF